MADVQRIHELMTRGDIAIVYSVTEAKAILSAAIHEAAQARVLIHRHYEPSAVILGIEDFTTLLEKAAAYERMMPKAGTADTLQGAQNERRD